MITLTAFRSVPPVVQGLVRDLRVRWALEEAGIPYQERLIGAEDRATAAYRALQPFGQVPAIEEGEFKLFESGAIVLRIAEGCEALMPSDPDGRARTVAWMFAAVNSVEPQIEKLAGLDLFNAGEAWAAAQRPLVVETVQKRLAALEARPDPWPPGAVGRFGSGLDTRSRRPACSRPYCEPPAVQMEAHDSMLVTIDHPDRRLR